MDLNNSLVEKTPSQTIQAHRLKRDIIVNYMDLVGILTVDRNPTPESTKNGLMHLGLYMNFLYGLGITDKSDMECFVDTVLSCEDGKGTYDRYPAYGDKPRNNDKNAHDDDRGIFSTSYIHNMLFHREIYKKGIIHNNVDENHSKFFTGWNPLKWHWWAFRPRMYVDFIWYYVANNKWDFITGTIFLLLMLSKSGKSLSYHTLLDYMILESMASKSKVWRKVRDRYVKNGNLPEATANYFGAGHAMVGLAYLIKEVTLNEKDK